MFRIEKTKELAVEKIQGLEFPFDDVMGIFITGWFFLLPLLSVKVGVSVFTIEYSLRKGFQ